MDRTWHSKPIEEALEELETDSIGLKEDEAERRLEKYGPNELLEKKRTSGLRIFLNQFRDIFVVMLLIATAIAFFAAYVENKAQTDTLTIAAIEFSTQLLGSFKNTALRRRWKR